ncbi:dynein light chain Tctex-type protein 2B-like [Dreissena polymorpha]|nr:dynein light chain Tctex-type protein 2B-like [Dreissena polymorpha]XP_052274781.1 dynein light chain Tctex-type protein 2B-like [Dreissena polymorpha]XP_052274782.1 dynein light chain Tctex-type protein 2B-like [Dreissena polymorpha]XP_052274783.1 dynein light chain Tctex-type protein 2B-like [Dreissena polymorpha]XP_052274784.1 dynein light chain Tctex-type protein 2B-like [Dreissena polymorpha]XP_052274785.1 dynein light chain Tctex-type protein 2B-like [Dreissena polymorpha]XP_05227478
MARMQTLTVENLSDHQTDHIGNKRPSLVLKEGSDGPHTTNPSMRRMSRFEGRPSVQYSRRMSMVSRSSVTGSSFGIKNIGLFPVKLQNTYKLQPDHSEVFKPDSVRAIIQEVLDECLNGEKYNPSQCRSLSQMLTDLIKSRVKDIGFQRYKYIVTVTIGQDSDQGFRVVSRCLWNKDTDNYAEASYNKNGLFAVAAVYACYFE